MHAHVGPILGGKSHGDLGGYGALTRWPMGILPRAFLSCHLDAARHGPSITHFEPLPPPPPLSPQQIRDLYWTFRNFHQRMLDFLRYRRITTNMDARFPDATAEDLARADHTCIICREEMVVGGRTKRLPCGHVFHLHCLRWVPGVYLGVSP